MGQNFFFRDKMKYILFAWLVNSLQNKIIRKFLHIEVVHNFLFA